MGIFIPGRTTCAICGAVIDKRSDTAQIPYIKPSGDLPPEFSTRPFVHRTCWNEWDERALVSAAALALIQDSKEDMEVRRVLYADNGMAVESWHAGFLRFHDVEMLVVIDIPFDSMSAFRDILSEEASIEREPMVVGAMEIRISGPHSGGHTTITAFVDDDDHEVIWSVDLSSRRRSDWHLVMEEAVGSSGA